MGVNNWGRWGADDERGALNHLTPEIILSAASSITSGKVYSFGIPIQGHGVPLLGHRGTPMRLTLQDGTDDGMFANFGAAEGTGAHEDVLVMASHTTSHMDALIHVYEEHKHYNGVPFSEMRAMSGASKLGIEKVDGFAARCVILDMVSHLGEEKWLEPGRMLTAAELEGAANAQGTEIRTGDVVCIRTGHLDMWWAANAAGEPEGFLQAGIGSDAAEWLAAKDVVAVGADNAAVEVIPFDNNEFLIVHKILLVRGGIYMMEHLNLGPAARDGNLEGIISVSPLKVTGATGSPINPIFIS